MDKPQATYTLDSHRYTFPDIEVLLENFAEVRDGDVRCDARIDTSRQPAPGMLYEGHLNLSSPRSRMDVLRMLTKREELSDVDWQGILQYVSSASKRRWQEGDPTVQLSTVKPKAQGRYLLPPFLEEGAACVLFGDGGNGKSTVAEAMAVSVATAQPLLDTAPPRMTPVLILDWEADEDIWAERLKAICEGVGDNGINMPSNIHYRHMSTSLPEAARTVRREVAKLTTPEGPPLIICDSLGLAGGDDPEAASTKIRAFAAARSFNCTFLAIDHVAHHDKTRPFGSVYTRNIARLIWGVHKAQKEGDSRLTVALRNEKGNHAQLFAPRAYHIDYVNTSDGHVSKIQFTPTDYEKVPEFTDMVPLKHKIEEQLKAGAQTVAEIAQAVSAKTNTVSQALKRGADDGQFVRFGDLWGKKARPETPDESQ